MICKPCADGADLISRKNTPGAINLAAASHGMCPGCDCQHNVEAQASGASLRERP